MLIRADRYDENHGVKIRLAKELEPELSGRILYYIDFLSAYRKGELAEAERLFLSFEKSSAPKACQIFLTLLRAKKMNKPRSAPVEDISSLIQSYPHLLRDPSVIHQLRSSGLLEELLNKTEFTGLTAI